MYIVYGAPDEKETHPATPGSPAYEEWLYRRTPGDVIIRFTDENGDGTYRQTPRQRGGRPQAAAKEDAVYEKDGASVRVGQGGATLITVLAGAVDVEIQRIAPAEGAVLRDRALWPSKEYTKLLSLKPGTYRMQAVVSESDPGKEFERFRVIAELENLRSHLTTLRQTYTDQHPRVLETEAQLRELQSNLRAIKARSGGPRTIQFTFEIK